MELLLDLACRACDWRPKDPTMFRFAKEPVCPSCGDRLIPAAALEPEPIKKTAWEHLLDGED